MKPFFGIVRLTLKTAIRSNIFQLLTVVLLFCIFFIPTSIAGDGTAQGYIQVSLKYSLAVIGFILSLSSIWLGCFIMSRDTETYQLHMVVTKSISRVTVWLGKWTGIVIIHFILLLFASATIYFIIQYQYHQQDFSEKERLRIDNEVMVARRVFMPDMPDMDAIARQLLAQRIEDNKKVGKAVDESQENLNKMLQDLKKEIIGSYSQIHFNTMREWQYKNLPTSYRGPVFFRFRMYVNKIGGNEQRQSRGIWIGGLPIPAEAANQDAKNVFEQKQISEQKFNFAATPLTPTPEQIMAGEFHERLLTSDFISPNGDMLLAFQNLDPGGGTLFFQPSDGPKVLVSAGTFTGNYCRAILIMLIQLVVMAGLGCAAASVLSMPTAVFLVISYLLAGSLAVLLAGTTYFGGAADYMGSYMGRMLLWFIIPLQGFEVSRFIAGGELIELRIIGLIFLHYFLLRGVPFFLLGMYLYNRRELGLVIRK